MSGHDATDVLLDTRTFSLACIYLCIYKYPIFIVPAAAVGIHSLYVDSKTCEHPWFIVQQWTKNQIAFLLLSPLHTLFIPFLLSSTKYCCSSSPQVPQHERMLRNTLQRKPLPWILLQQFRNQILGILWQSMRPTNIHPLNPPIRGTMTLRFKRWHTHKELIQQYPQCPRIHLLIVFMTLHHLRR